MISTWIRLCIQKWLGIVEKPKEPVFDLIVFRSDGSMKKMKAVAIAGPAIRCVCPDEERIVKIHECTDRDNWLLVFASLNGGTLPTWADGTPYSFD